MDSERRLEIYRSDVQSYAQCKLGKKFYIVSSPYEGDYIFQDRLKSYGIWAAAKGDRDWMKMPCVGSVFKIDERYDNHVQGGGSLGKALIGGALFGGIGAIVGAAGQGTQVSNLTKLSIRFNYTARNIIMMDLVGSWSPVATQSLDYQMLMSDVKTFIQTAVDLGATYGGTERFL